MVLKPFNFGEFFNIENLRKDGLTDRNTYIRTYIPKKEEPNSATLAEAKVSGLRHADGEAPLSGRIRQLCK